MTINELYNELKQLHNYENSNFEVKQIILSVLNIKPIDFIMKKNDVVNQNLVKLCKQFVLKRNTGVPLYYILGKCEFYSLPFYVGEGVLIPRADTETLVDFALDCIENIKSPKVLDLCSGSGCIAIAIAKNRPDCVVDAVEYYDQAYEYLQKNISLNEASNVKAIKADALEFVGDYDLVVSNPPYIAYCEKKSLQTEVLNEPHTALFADEEGYYFYRKIAENFKNKREFTIAFEVGINMDTKIGIILRQNGYSQIQSKKDLCGVNRVVSASI